MKNISYRFGSLPQFLCAGFAFLANVLIPYAIGDAIGWVTVTLVTVSVFLASGFQYNPHKG